MCGREFCRGGDTLRRKNHHERVFVFQLSLRRGARSKRKNTGPLYTQHHTHCICTNSKRNTTCDESTAAIQEKVGVVSAADIMHGFHGRAKKEERGAPRRSIMIRVWSIHSGCGNEARSCIFGLGLKCLRHRRGRVPRIGIMLWWRSGCQAAGRRRTLAAALSDRAGMK